MFLAVLLAASGLPIPFGTPSEPAPAATRDAPRIETSFEFAENPRGYQLNALVFDLHDGGHRSIPISACQSIDVDSFSADDFGTPVTCDGVSYSFDLRGPALVVDGAGAQTSVEVQRFDQGRVWVNGMPLLIE